jgi:hypothetical protein
MGTIADSMIHAHHADASLSDEVLKQLQQVVLRAASTRHLPVAAHQVEPAILRGQQRISANSLVELADLQQPMVKEATCA